MINEKIIGIVVDKTKFAKISKKMMKQINLEYNLDLNLSKVQEILSHSFNYRNFNELQKSLSTPTTNSNASSEKTKKEDLNHSLNFEYLFNNSSAGSLMVLFSIFLPPLNDFWSVRAEELVALVINFLVSTKEHSGNYITLDLIEKSLDLNELINLAKDEKYPQNERDFLIHFLKRNVGGDFNINASKQSSSYQDQYGFLTMQTTPIFNFLSKVMKNDVVLLRKRWFTNDKKTVSEQPYNHAISRNDISDKNDLLDEIKNSYIYEDSWLSMSGFDSCIATFNKSNKKDYYVSDLLKQIIITINPDRSENLKNILVNLLRKYEQVESMSKNIDNMIFND